MADTHGWRPWIGYMLAATAAVAVSLYVLSGFYVVDCAERAVVERFGRPVNRDDPTGPGLHYHLPWPIERVRLINTERTRTVGMGYAGVVHPDAHLWSNIQFGMDHLALVTGERFFVNLHATVTYRVSDPGRYLYRCVDPGSLLRAVADTTLSRLVASRQLWAMLADRRRPFEVALRDRIAAQVAFVGVTVVDVRVRDLHPPGAAVRDFEDVQSAAADRETIVHHAHAYQAQQQTEAWVETQRVLTEAHAAAAATAATCGGQTASYLARLAVYRDYRRVVSAEMYLSAMGRALSAVRLILVPPDLAGDRLDLWFLPAAGANVPVGPTPRAPAPAAPERRPETPAAPPQRPEPEPPIERDI